MKQLRFILPEIDREATRKKVEEALETARIYKQIGFVRREMKQTPSYEPRFHGATNAVGKPAEECAVWNVDTEERLRSLTERVEQAVSRLGRTEREIIEKRYLEDEETFDYQVWSEIGMSERTYYRAKSRAFYKLAFMLCLEVYTPLPEVAIG
ncbi:ArpU family transcriptional regulator [Heliobacillus mobilis]|uniref:ArpU family transcriptional regulator n=1 Tax=Heliobacterium mobile TaxID=28064 RepID=A0A6I3SDH3_HELMO|nr:ArpU family transcriptional regulator [Heliobacterium mobile]